MKFEEIRSMASARRDWAIRVPNGDRLTVSLTADASGVDITQRNDTDEPVDEIGFDLGDMFALKDIVDTVVGIMERAHDRAHSTGDTQ